MSRCPSATRPLHFAARSNSPAHFSPTNPRQTTRAFTTMTASPDGFDRRQRLQDMVSELKHKFPNVPTITARDVHNACQSSSSSVAVILVDVRTPEEFAISRLPGALAPAEFEAQQEQFKQRAVVVAYCTVGYRSSQYVQKLQREGFAAKNLEGSILAWTQEGLPLVSGGGEGEKDTKRVHVFAKRWELQGDGYEAVTFSQPLAALAAAWLRGAWPRWVGGTGA